MDNFIAAMVGFVSAIFGGYFQVYASSRVSTRTQGRVAARLAGDGLSRWTPVAGILRRWQPSDPTDEGYDIDLAIVLGSIRKSLESDTLAKDWWEANRPGLVAVASDDHWAALAAAGLAGRGALMLLTSVGDVGREVTAKRGEALAIPASGSASRSESSTEADAPGPKPAGLDAVEKEAKKIEDDANAIFAAGMRELAVLRASLDYRLGLVRDVRATLISAGAKFEAAARVCRAIEQETRSPLGWWGAIRRRRSSPRA